MIFPLKTILIEDEPLSRKRLKNMLEKHVDIFNIVAEAKNGMEAVDLINHHFPDIIFLDIQLPGFNGFEVLERLSKIPMVIFITAYDEYAMRAFEANTIDYLLKPIEQERIDKTVEKLKLFSNTGHKLDITMLRHIMDSIAQHKEPTTIPVKTSDKIILLRLDTIAFFEAQDKYVTINLANGQTHLTDDSLTTLQEKLPNNFVRIHRAYIVNKHYIKEIRKQFNQKVAIELNDTKHTKICSGSSYFDVIKNLINF